MNEQVLEQLAELLNETEDKTERELISLILASAIAENLPEMEKL